MNDDQETILAAIENARRIVAEYMVPGRRDVPRMLDRLLPVLHNEEVDKAVDRLARRRIIRLVD